MRTPITDYPLYWIPLLPLLGAAINLILGKRLPRRWVGIIASAAVGLSCLVVLHAVAGPLYDNWKSARLAAGEHPVVPIADNVFTWIQSGGLTINLRFLLDPLSGVMVLTVTFVGFLIHVYSIGYMAKDPRLSTYFGYLNLFTGAMLILVLGDSLPVMFIGWEGVGLCSYLLIGFWFDKDKNATAGRKAFIVNRIGDCAFLVGIFLLWSTTHRLDFQGLAQAADKLAMVPQNGMGLPLAFWAGLALFGGAIGKSAQVPLYVWLPDAMAGPTPVSALIHAATMVTAGVYMVARLSFVYLAAPQMMLIVASVGAFTALYAALIGFAQNDIKKVLAYSTVSQLGFMFVAVGVGATSAGIFHLFTHAFFKAGLFLGAGSVMHAMSDTTDIMRMGGLRKKTPITHAVFLIYCLTITGLPPFSGFFSKDEILLSTFVAHHPHWPSWFGYLLWGVLSTAALGTAFYMWRLYFLVFHGESRADEETQHHIHESPLVMTIPLMILAAGAVFLGLLGLPEHLNFFATWVNQVDPVRLTEMHAASGTMYGLMGVATALGLAGVGAAYLVYKDGPEAAKQRVTNALGPLRTWAEHKFYVDELYEFVLLRPFRYLTHVLYQFVDKILIDGLLTWVPAFFLGVVGRVTMAFQNGDVQRYMIAMLVGIVAIFYVPTCSETGFTAKVVEGTTVHVRAGLADGVVGRGSRIEWDFDGSQQFRVVGPDASYTYNSPNDYLVLMRVTDVWGKQHVVKQRVKVGTPPGRQP